jgi:hypothetical protein
VRPLVLFPLCVRVRVRCAGVNVLSYTTTTQAYGQSVNQFKGGDPVHNWYASVAGNQPVFLLVEDVYEAWAWTALAWNVRPQDPSLFVLPANCTPSC